MDKLADPTDLRGTLTAPDGSLLMEVPGEIVMIDLLRALASQRLTLKHNVVTGLLRVQRLTAAAAMHAGD